MGKMFNGTNTTIVLGAHRPGKLFIKHTTEHKRYPPDTTHSLHAASARARKLNFDLQPYKQDCNQRRAKPINETETGSVENLRILGTKARIFVFTILLLLRFRQS